MRIEWPWHWYARHWALRNVRRNGGDRRTCGHTDLHGDVTWDDGNPLPGLLPGTTSRGGNLTITCIQCAIELGRREGQVEAGAYYTNDEVFGPRWAPRWWRRLVRRIGRETDRREAQ